MSDRPEATILLVDDDEPKRYSLARTLRRAGYMVVEAARGPRGSGWRPPDPI